MASAQDAYRNRKPEAFSADRGPSPFELWSWVFMRISGVLLLFLVLIHLYVIHLTGEGVHQVDFAFVSSRWDNVGWKTFDWLMLFLALLHGVNGLRIVVNDYIRSAALRAAVKISLYTVGGVLLVMGTAVVVTFQPGG